MSSRHEIFGTSPSWSQYAERIASGRRADELEMQVKELAARFENAFWCPEIAAYTIALDERLSLVTSTRGNIPNAFNFAIANADKMVVRHNDAAVIARNHRHPGADTQIAC